MHLASRLIACIVPVALAGCVTPGTTAAPGTVSKALCRGESLTGFIGQKADEAVGNAILKASGARTLRWAPPRSAMTMDFRPDRVTIGYDDAMIITSTNCG